MKHLDITDYKQGNQLDGPAFGYCGIDGRGGQFFTWLPTLDETLASIEDNMIGPPVDWPDSAYAEVREFIRAKWSDGYRGDTLYGQPFLRGDEG